MKSSICIHRSLDCEECNEKKFCQKIETTKEDLEELINAESIAKMPEDIVVIFATKEADVEKRLPCLFDDSFSSLEKRSQAMKPKCFNYEFVAYLHIKKLV